MTLQNTAPSLSGMNLEGIDFISVMNQLDDGVIISNLDGTILFYNRAQSVIDGISQEDAIGVKITEIYDLTHRTSLMMQCMIHNASIRNKTFFYRTCKGKVVHTITSAYPLYDHGRVNGAICFIKDYELLHRSTPAATRESTTPDQGNATRYNFSHLIGSGHGFRHAIEIARKAALSTSPIMIQGETGTGKELFAQAIHNQGPRCDNKFVAVNCAAIPHDLLEGMLFGTTRGAFTGALDKPGLFEIADGSTLFLDELLAMPISLQAKLLRAIQEKSVRRLGSVRETPVNVKVISSVNQDPRAAIRNELLRTDLFYRLGVVMIKLPPLRERIDDMEELAGHFIGEFNTRLGSNVQSISSEVMELFKAYHWPGNIREFEHLIEGAMNLVGQDKTIGLQHFGPGLDCLEKADMTCTDPGIFLHGSHTQENSSPFQFQDQLSFAQSQKQREQNAVRSAMAATNGNVTQAARQLGISRQLLHYKLKRFGINRQSFIPHP
ncbi:MAG: PAS domain-containing protein [Desulfobacteraceae bacterium]|nr:MAG: PAS domain-containing protein [Desulfobacteraceae bacterium]